MFIVLEIRLETSVVNLLDQHKPLPKGGAGVPGSKAFSEVQTVRVCDGKSAVPPEPRSLHGEWASVGPECRWMSFL